MCDLGYTEKTKGKNLPVLSSVILQVDQQGQEFDEKWHYRSVIGKLNFLEKSTRPDIAYVVHQCAIFFKHPKKVHADAVKQLVRYLFSTKEEVINLHTSGKSLECCVDADFVGNWSKNTAHDDVNTVRSRSGYVILYSGCPVSWA